MDISQEILSDITVYMKYARYLPKLKRRETWEELCTRNMIMHKKKFPRLSEEIEDIYQRFVFTKKILPSMRSMQFAGKPIDVNPSRIYNCAFMPIDCVEAFSEAMFLLLGGTGVGFSVQKQHVDRLPILQGVLKPTGKHRKQRFLVADSIEGWADAIKALMSSYFLGKKELDFDFRDIRPKGTALVTAGGRAPGEGPLRRCLVLITNILENALQERSRGTKLKPIEVHDIICHIADAVLAGGIRRAALLSLFSKDDQEMLFAKSGKWYINNPQRGRANNSACFIRSIAKKKDFLHFWEIVKNSESGEPGIYWTNDPNWGVNPCQPGWASVLTPNGIRQLKDINIGDIIWSHDEWTKIINKWSNGIKDIFKYKTTSCVFYGTKTHRIVSNDEKVAVKEAASIDELRGCDHKNIAIDIQDVMDGLVIGDGSVHKASNNLVYLFIGDNDQDYLRSEIKDLIVKHRPGLSPKAWEIQTTITPQDMDYKYQNYIPDRFFYGPPHKAIGFLRGLFSANGSVVGERVTLKSASQKLVEQTQILLNSLGITNYITTNKSKLIKFANGEYQCKQSYDINIAKDRVQFSQLIGFIQQYKNDKLKTINLIKSTRPPKQAFDIIESEYISTEEVFDITVDNESHTYWTGGCNVSNCCEIGLRPRQFCNLTEINAGDIDSQDELNNRSKAAAFIATLQAAYTDFHYLIDEWRENTEKDALLGVSMTGICSGKVMKLNLEEAAERVNQENVRVANLIGINKAARQTCIKPAGTTSLTLGCSSGMHAWHARYYIRRIRVGKNEAIYSYLKKKLPFLVEDEIFSPHDTAVIQIPQKAPDHAILRTESSEETLKRLEILTQNWVVPGYIDGSNSHNVSCTLSIKEDEWDTIGEWMWKNRNMYNGISVLPYDGGTYQQAPFEKISKEEYDRLFQQLKNVDLSKIIEEEDHTDLTGELACAGGACEIK
mgnify:CR=1 FL=1